MKEDKRNAAQKFKDFHQRKHVKTIAKNVVFPEEWIKIGEAFEIAYKSNKWDGKNRLYVHKLKKHGNILVSPKGDLVLITDVKLNIKKEGLTG